MGTQISLKLSEEMLKSAKSYSKEHGFDSLQDFIREMMRRRLYERHFTELASEESLAEHWDTKEEDEAWAYLQKEK